MNNKITPAEINKIRSYHQEAQGYSDPKITSCNFCHENWPCAVFRLTAAYEDLFGAVPNLEIRESVASLAQAAINDTKGQPDHITYRAIGDRVLSEFALAKKDK